jgi:hypothetical protein
VKEEDAKTMKEEEAKRVISSSNLLDKIRELSNELQVTNCGYATISFLKKLLIDNPTIYNFEGRIMGRKETEATIILDCKFYQPKVYLTDYFEESIKKFMIKSNNRPILVLNLALVNVYKNYGHSNLLIIDKRTKIVERFEPRGKSKYYDDMCIETCIRKLVKEFFPKFTYLSPYEYMYDEGPQSKQKMDLSKELKEGNGLCVNYTILYAYLRLKDELIPKDAISFMNTHFLDETILKFTHYVNNYYCKE